ncbi:MAG: hypothetical protein IJ390_10095 [Lachnospiraceae bacterium]|nr:hypothetical protein [Lachnospiraceae bacterium]
MNFVYESELLEHMQQKGQKTIVVEVIDAQHSDIEIQDFHVHLISERMANIFKTERKYRSVPTEHGEVLLPRYRLEYDETVTFGLKKFLCFKSVTFQGIRF